MVSRAYAWIATGGGAWSLASNWDDLTDGIDPSLTVPGPQDSVTVDGPTGSAVMTLTGQGDVLSAAFEGNTIATGSLTIGTVALGASGDGGLLDVGGGGAIVAGTLTAATGSVIASGPGSLIDAASLVLGEGQSGYGAAACALDATSGGMVQVGSLLLDAGSASLYADGVSSIEIGTLGGAASGALTIDAGATLSGEGQANAYGSVVNNGTIAATGGVLMLGNLSGTGLLSIGADAVLDLNGRTGAGQSVLFAGAQGTLALAMELNAPQGTLTGFAPGDAIDELGSPISAATYLLTKTGLGTLTLYYGNQVADTLILAGNYNNDVFLTAGDGAGGTIITVAPNSKGGGGASGGTASPDNYVWVANGGGNWNAASNWEDLTTGANPAKVAPGVNNLDTINAPQTGGFDVIEGPANAALLAVTGDLALGGTYAIGTLAVGLSSGTVGQLDLLPGVAMTAGAVALEDGGLSVSASAVLAVAGAMTLGGGESGVGLPITALSATAGGTITALSLTMGGGTDNTVTTDTTGVIEIGAAGGAVAGAVTVDAGAMLTGNGEVNPFGAIVDNGAIDALGGVLTLGSVTGTGVLAIGTDSGLLLNAGTTLPVGFADATGLLAVADERVALTGVIGGFVPGDVIDILNDPITSFASATKGGNTVVTLYYGSTAVDTFTLGGTYANMHFVLAPDGENGTDLLVVQGHGGGGGGGGQGDTDLLAWATPGSGAWDKTGNWYDVTTGSAALAPPGAENAVELIGTTGSFQMISGPGVCASLACFGDTLLGQAFTTGTLLVGGMLNGAATAAVLDVGASSGATAAIAIVDGGTLLVDGASATLSVTGTLTLGGANDGALAASSHGTAALGGLVLAGIAYSSVTADITSSVEIGTLGTGALGAVTVDAGFAISGYGAINPVAAVADNGTITAQGGTLEVGAVSGTGVLSIAGEATLLLTSTEACPIDFAGGGATLELAGTAETPAGVIDGFAAGDFIITGASQVSAVAYTPGAGGVGTLVLYSGDSVAGSLLLAGDYSGDSFFVQPDGEGSAIAVQQASGGPSPGTPTPDDYVWTGAVDDLWNTNGNWSDITAGQQIAAIAPGSHDLVTIQGGTGSFTTIIGPADAASLSIAGSLVLSGQFSIGALSIAGGGVLALGQGTVLQDQSAAVGGGVLVDGAAFSTGLTLSLAGVLDTADGAAVQAGAMLLSAGSALATDASSSIEIGAAGGAAQGAVTIDPGAVLAGAGTVDPLGAIVDQGTITASGGTLVLGSVAGSGDILIGVNAALDLAGSAGAGLLIDFTGAGTLTAGAGMPLSVIAGFGDSDTIFLPISGATDAVYVATGPNIGVLTISGNGQTLGQLTLAGVGQGQTFTLAATQGGTSLTTTITDWGGGGSGMNNNQPTSGGGASGIVSDFSWWAALPLEVQNQLAAFQSAQGNNCYVWTSPDGSSGSWGEYQPGYANFAVAVAPVPYTKVVLPPGYEALLVQGGNPAVLTDGGAGGVLLMGNQANDSIVGFGDNDTLVGGAGGNSVIWAADTGPDGTHIYGGGNDTIVGGSARTVITTSNGGRSIVFLGGSSSTADLLGNDTVVMGGSPGAIDTVTAAGADTVFGPGAGELIHYGGTGADLIVAGSGSLEAYGGAGNGGVLWAGNAAIVNYFGGGGSELVIGGSGLLSVQGGGGAMTVFGGSGNAILRGSPGPSQFILGSGAATVTAASGNDVWLAGAANDSLIASGGNVLLWARGATGDNVLQAGSGPVTMVGGLGSDTLLAGTGSATMTGGGGYDIFSFTNGLAGGSDQITDFNTTNDLIQLHGYSGYTNEVVNGSEVLTLADGTTIQLDGLTSLAGVHISVG